MSEVTLERTILSVLVFVGTFTLLGVAMVTTQAHDYFTPIVAFVGPLCGAVVSWWFRLNGDAQQNGNGKNTSDPH